MLQNCRPVLLVLLKIQYRFISSFKLDVKTAVIAGELQFRAVTRAETVGFSED
jgi:hypothetical protein